MAVEELADLVATDARLRTLTKELKTAVQARGSHLMDLHGIGPAGAARILADVGGVGRPWLAVTVHRRRSNRAGS